MEELTDNAEEPDEAESKQSEVKLGKLQYKVQIVIYRIFYLSILFYFILYMIAFYSSSFLASFFSIVINGKSNSINEFSKIKLNSFREKYTKEINMIYL